MDNKAAEDYMLKQAKSEGKAEGKAELIQMMLNTGNSVNDIAKVTGLSVDEIEKLI
jgi:predicted transposase/invertase (TIGR01784 family)